MTMNKTLLLTLPLFATLGFSSAQAQIAVVGSMSADVSGDTSVTLDIQPGNDVVLVLGNYRRNSVATPITLSWSGGSSIPVTQLVTENLNDNNRSSTIFGISLGTVSAAETVTFNFGSSDGRAAASAIQLTGATLAGYQGATNEASGSQTDFTASLSNVTAGSLVFGFGASTNRDATFAFDSVDATQTRISTNRDAYQSAYALNSLAGDVDFVLDLTTPNGGDYVNMAAVAIAPIPEPSTYALLLGGLSLGILMIRRRK